MLTSSSPTISAPPSPSSAFHAPHPHSRSSYHVSRRPRSPRFSPRFTVNSASAQTSPLAPSPVPPPPPPPPSGKRSDYRDSGTQYSPNGYPPTYHPAPHSDPNTTLPSLPVAPGSTPQHQREATPAAPEATEPPEPDVRIDPQPVVSAHHVHPTGGVAEESGGSSSAREERAGRGEVAEGEGGGGNQRPQQRLKQSVADTLMPESSPAKRARSLNQNVKVMPLQYETCDIKDLGVLISDMLMELVRLNDEFPLRDGQLTRFHSRAPPAISVRDYLFRLIVHATLSPPILLSMVFYVDKLCTMYPAFTISSLTVHRFLITAATVAAKGLSDSFWTNSLYAKVGGVSLRELALLEVEFLKRLEWRIVPKPETLVDYYKGLVDRGEGYTLEKTSENDPETEGLAVMADSQETIPPKVDAEETQGRP